MIHLSPAYDLLPTKLLLPRDPEETALAVNGKKSNLTRRDIDTLGSSLELSDRQIVNVHNRLRKGLEAAKDLIPSSFVSAPSQERFTALILERASRLWKE